MVLLTPGLAALHEWRPDLWLSVLIEPGYEPVLEGNPAVSETLTVATFSSAVAAVRRGDFSILFNQHAGPCSALLTAASGISPRVCWQHRQFGFLYNVLAPDPDYFYGTNDVHTVEQRMTQFYWTGLPRGPIPPSKVYPQPDAIAAVRQKLVALGIQPFQPYALLRPGASMASKRWPAARFLALARWLRNEHGMIPVMNTGPGEESIAAVLQAEPQPAAVRLDGLSLRELIALIAGASLLVGNDTGPTHIAAAAGCPVTVIFGASNAVTWRPWSAKYRLLQGAPGENAGILSVGLAEVQQACAELIAEAKSGRAIGERLQP
jgi:ADP-heptose:LPS heptosyltransferase